jgi:hypothetical protein
MAESSGRRVTTRSRPIWWHGDLLQTMNNKLVKIISESIHPLLKSIGFRKKGRRWNRTRGNFVDVVQIQESTFRLDDRVDFTVNLGVFIPEFWEIIWGKSFTGIANEADCAVRNRLGDLLQGRIYGDSTDTWWSVSRYDDSEEADFSVVNEVAFGLMDRAISYLEGFDNYEKIAIYILKQKGSFGLYALSKIQLALAQWKAGCVDDATQTLKKINNNAWHEKVDLVNAFILNTKFQR